MTPNNWQEENNHLIREFAFADFGAAVKFVDQVAALAEAADHHPDILLYSYNHVKISLSTHAVGVITEKDRQLALKINEIV